MAVVDKVRALFAGGGGRRAKIITQNQAAGMSRSKAARRAVLLPRGGRGAKGGRGGLGGGGGG